MDAPPEFDPSDFSTHPAAHRTTKPWGYEILLTPEGSQYAAKLIHVNAGKRLSLQVHDKKTETQTLLKGKGFLVLEDETGTLQNVPLEAGRGVSHRGRPEASPVRLARPGRDRLRGVHAGDRDHLAPGGRLPSASPDGRGARRGSSAENAEPDAEERTMPATTSPP